MERAPVRRRLGRGSSGIIEWQQGLRRATGARGLEDDGRQPEVVEHLRDHGRFLDDGEHAHAPVAPLALQHVHGEDTLQERRPIDAASVRGPRAP